jgi:lipopolysaccharide export system permease protein
MAVTGVALGFGFVMVNGMFDSLGKIDILPPAAAAWTAPALFTTAGIWMLLMKEE